MLKKYFKIEKHKKKLALIDDNIGKLYYSDLLEIGSKLSINNSVKKKLVFLICKNNYETIIGYLSFLRSNTCVLLLNQNMKINNFKSLIDLYHPDYIYCPSNVKNSFPGFKKKTSIGSYSLIKTNLSKDFQINKKLALLLPTSGSTGNPQVVRQSYQNIISNSNAISNFLKIRSTDKVITTLPMNYTYGLSIINSHLLKGSCLVLTENSIITRKFWNLFKKNHVTTFGGVPYTFEILKKIKFEKMFLPSLRYITQAGGKLDNNLINYFYKVSIKKNYKFIIMYGQTEATARMSYLKWEALKDKKNSIGKPISGGKFYLIDANYNKINKNNTFGELVYKGDNVCVGDANNRFDLQKDDENKKLLLTGDIAVRDKDGFYYIKGRKKRFIKLFGHRINLDDIEKLIKVLGCDCACKGDDKKISIFLESTGRIYRKKIEKILNKKIEAIKNAYELLFVKKIPRNESGKILYSKLH